MKMEKGSFEMMKQLNQQIVLQQIRDRSPISRADIAKNTQLTPPTVSKVVMELLDAGFIQETEIGESNGGRRPILLTINPDGGYVVGLNITADQVEVLIVDLAIHILARSKQSLPTSNPEEICKLIVDSVNQMISKLDLPRKRVLGVGIAIDCLVDHLSGVSICAPQLQWDNWPICETLEAQLGLPVKVDNSVRLMAVGEMWFGAAQDSKNFAYINVDSEVGTGIVLNGQILRGVNYSAGEIAHIQIEPHGPYCQCGKQGCLGALISLSALEGLESNKIRQVVATYLGRGIAAMTQLLDLRKVIVGGRVFALAPGIVEAVKSEMQAYFSSQNHNKTEITLGTLGTDASIIGAITMILTDFYEGGNWT